MSPNVPLAIVPAMTGWGRVRVGASILLFGGRVNPDKAHTVTMAAAILMTTGLGPCSAVEEAATLYDLAVERVRARGPTSKEVECKHGDGTICCDFDCPRHGNG